MNIIWCTYNIMHNRLKVCTTEAIKAAADREKEKKTSIISKYYQ